MSRWRWHEDDDNMEDEDLEDLDGRALMRMTSIVETWMERTRMARIEISKWMVMEKMLIATTVDQLTMTLVTSAIYMP